MNRGLALSWYLISFTFKYRQICHAQARLRQVDFSLQYIVCISFSVDCTILASKNCAFLNAVAVILHFKEQSFPYRTTKTHDNHCLSRPVAILLG